MTSIFATVLALTAWFIARSATASFSRLLDTHSSGRTGSPIVAGSTNRWRSSSIVGSALLESGRPAPRRRIRDVVEDPSARSFAPRNTRRPKDGGCSAIARGSLLRRDKQPAASFIQLVLDGRIPHADGIFIDHPRIVATKQPRRNPLSELAPTRIAYSCSGP